MPLPREKEIDPTTGEKRLPPEKAPTSIPKTTAKRKQQETAQVREKLSVSQENAKSLEWKGTSLAEVAREESVNTRGGELCP